MNDITDEILSFTVPEDCAGLRLDQVLARLLPEHSRSRLKQWIEAGRVTVDGIIVAPKTRLLANAQLTLRIEPTPEATAAPAQDIALNVVYEDDWILVLNKPAGLTVHPGAGNPHGTLMNALLFHAPQLAQLPRAGIVHRLDKDTSGLMVVAKNEAAHTDLVRQLAARTVKRTYRALVWGNFAENEAVIEAPIGRHPKERTKMAVVTRGKPARTHVHVDQRFGYATLLTCQLDTGRTHQIRVHLAALRHPIVGDPVYGKPRRHPDAPECFSTFKRQALHATRLALQHPQDQHPCVFNAELPEDFAGLLKGEG